MRGGAVIDLMGKGFVGGLSADNTDARGMTFGNTFATPNSAGTHAGHGTNAAPGSGFGLFRAPTTPGGGGSSTNGTTRGGNGGGALHVTAGNLLRMDGSINVQGEGAPSGAFGGAGGSVFLEANQLDFRGYLYANGANGGGGGRVAIIYDTDLFGSWPVSQNILASGVEGGVGTIFTKSSTQSYGSLRFENGYTSSTTTPTLLPAEPGNVLNLDSLELRYRSRVTTPNTVNAASTTIDTSSELVP